MNRLCNLPTLPTKLPSLILVLLTLAALPGTTGCRRKTDVGRELEAANRDFEASRLERAKIQYWIVLKKQPTNSVALLRLGQIYFREGQFADAYPFLMAHRNRSVGDRDGLPELSSIELAMGRLAEARTNALMVLDSSPTNELALINLMQASQSRAELRDLESHLTEWQKRVGDRAAFHVIRSLIAMRTPNLSAADEELGKALKLNPQSSLVYSSIGSLRLIQGAIPEAERAYRTAAQLDPKDGSPRFRLAVFLLGTGREEEAKKLLDDINRDSPEITAAWIFRGEIALGERQWDACGRLVKRALEQAPRDPQARSLDARLRLAQGKTKEGVEILKSLVADHPNSSELLYQLGLAQLAAREVDAAATNLRQAVALSRTNNLQATLTLAQLDIARGLPMSAVTLLNDLPRRGPDLAQAHFLLGAAYASMGRTQEALGVYRDLKLRMPTNSVLPYQIGLLLRQSGDLAGARTAFEESRKLAPEQIEPISQLIGLELLADAPDRATALLQPELDRRPNSAALWTERARIEAFRKNLAGSETALKKAIELSPETSAPYLLLANQYQDAGRSSDALDILDSFEKKQPTDPAPLLLRGLILAKSGKAEESKKAYLKALTLQPESVEGLNNLADLLSESLHDPEAGFVQASKARQLAPTNPIVADTLGWIEYRRGHYPAAIRLLTEAQAQQRDNPEVAAHLGLAQYMMASEEPARQNLSQALRTVKPFANRDLAEQRLAVLSIDTRLPAKERIDRLAKVTHADATDLLAFLKLGMASEEAQDSAGARRAYEAVLRLNRMIVEATIRLAYLQIEDNPAKAADLARQAQLMVPNEPRASLILGRVALRSGDGIGAYGLLQAASRQMTNDAALCLDLADAAFQIGHLAESTNWASLALKNRPSAAQAKMSQTFINILVYTLSPNSGPQGSTEFEHVLKESPQSGPALFASAINLEKGGRFAEARNIHEQLLQKYPSFSPAMRQLAVLYAERFDKEPGADKKAYEWATKARPLLPQDDLLAKTLGRLAYRKGDSRYALQLFSEVERRQPQDGDLQYRIGLAQLSLKQTANGIASLQKAIQFAPNAAFVPDAQRLISENRPK